MDRGRSWGRRSGRRDRQWELVQQGDVLLLSAGEWRSSFSGDVLDELRVTRRWVGAVLEVAVEPPLRLSGMRRREGAELERLLSTMRADWRARAALSGATELHRRALEAETSALGEGRWLPRETLDHLVRLHPGPGAATTLRDVPSLIDRLGPDEAAAVTFLGVNLEAWAAGINERVLAGERKRNAEFFAGVESRPLTDEQVRAVVCMDNRVHVVASAGSGKTSVMVARAAYAIKRGFVAPDRVLLLAFNRDAAEELRLRVSRRLEALGLPSTGVTATTFHAFGLRVIGEATGRKPRPAAWLEGGRDVEMVSRIVDELRDASPEFAYRWDLFRLLYSRPTETADGGEPDGWDREAGVAGFRTAQGEVVKSEGERIIADWLFYNGVEYEYEKPYAFDTADRSHSQYRPDFFYPRLDVWHEHWALDHQGLPPSEFRGYAESMRWKRDVHRQRGTSLIETTWAEIIDQSGLAQLGETLRAHGASLDWNPHRPVRGSEPLRDEDLARLVRAFMTHVKSNGLDRQALDDRLAKRMAPASAPRTRLFLQLYWEIHDAWQGRLKAEGAVDFEDMLVDAARHVESGAAQPPYELVMVDEFQDASQVRARLTRALVSTPGRYLLAVGDDWQSINRFAGADISVVTGFEAWFGPGPTLRLETTFRCPQSICDTAGAFVAENPRQLRKRVVSAREGFGDPVELVLAPSREALPAAITAWLDRLQSRVVDGTDRRLSVGKVTVFVLGRYRHEADLVPRRRWADLDVTFMTVHGSKGLEADFVVVPNVIRGRFGFPSSIRDDTLLDLVMAAPDRFPAAEERRLFYVALTRARRGVVLFSVTGEESPFVVELVEKDQVRVLGGSSAPTVHVCPRCRQGSLVRRHGKFGAFLGCSRFPQCRHTEAVGTSDMQPRGERRNPTPGPTSRARG